ncbi:hypothetical protein V7659_29755 [Neobacillus drentensis]|uniref:hypothetical protein n=2 Tax=Neobacillus drentensis TaxID=220684 RepID=UPI002FFFB300
MDMRMKNTYGRSISISMVCFMASKHAMEGGDYHDQGFAELNNFVNGLIYHGTKVAYKRI